MVREDSLRIRAYGESGRRPDLPGWELKGRDGAGQPDNVGTQFPGVLTLG